MRSFIIISFLIFCSNFTFSQVELVLETDEDYHDLRQFLYSTQSNLNGKFQLTDEKVFLRVNSSKIVYVDEENEQLSTAVKFSDSIIDNQMVAYDYGVYYSVNNGSNSGTFTLSMIDNNLEVHDYFSHDYDMWITLSSHGFFFEQAGKNILFFLEDKQRKRFFKFDTETKQTEQIVDYSKGTELNMHSVNNEGVLFSRFPNSGRVVRFIDANANIHTLISENIDIEDVTWIENNDPDNFYLSFKYEDNVDSVFRYDYNTFERSFFSSTFLSGLHFNQNRVLGSSGSDFSSNNFLGKMENDTLAIVHAPIPISEDFPQNYAYYRPRLMDAQREIFSYATPEFGLELFTINEQDSIDIIEDLNQGIGHGVPFDHCDQITRLPNGILRYGGEAYFNMTNGNDNDVYLYKVSKDSLEPIFKIKDYNPGRIRYFTHHEFLYYFVYDRESEKNKLYRVKWSEMNDVQPANISFDSKTWATETSFKIRTQICQTSGWNNIIPLNIIADNKNNAYTKSAAINTYSESWLFDRKNKTEINTNLCNAYHKYDEYGRLKWMKTIGGTYKSGFTMYDKFVLDDNNNLQIYGVFFKKAYFDNDSLETTGSARFYAKLSGETGEVLEKKKLYETDYTDIPSFDALIKGEDNFFYLAGRYMDFKQNFGDTTLISTWNYQNFLAKYDDNGNLVWVRNILNNWNDVIGEINNIEYSEENNEIMVFCSQNSSFCSNKTLKNSEIIIYDIDGNEKQRKGFKGKYRLLDGKAVSINKQYFLIKGTINEAIETDVYESIISEEDCHELYDYQLIYDRQQNKFISAEISDSISGINIKRVLQDEDYIYYCGNRISGGDIVIQRFDKEGFYRGEKVLNQQAVIRVIDFALHDNHFVLIMQDAESDSFLKVNPIFSDVRNVMNVIRFEVKDWDYLQTFTPMSVKFVEEDVNLFAYPNPTIDFVQINFTNENNIFKNYRVVSGTGQILFQDDVPDQNFVRIDLSNHENGLYFIQFVGDGKRETIKVLKQP